MKLFLVIYFSIIFICLSCKKYPLYSGPNPRNDLIRKFSLKNVDKWITSVDKLNLDKVVDNVIVYNISNIKSVSTKLKEKVKYNNK